MASPVKNKNEHPVFLNASAKWLVKDVYFLSGGHTMSQMYLMHIVQEILFSKCFSCSWKFATIKLDYIGRLLNMSCTSISIKDFTGYQNRYRYCYIAVQDFQGKAFGRIITNSGQWAFQLKKCNFCAFRNHDTFLDF